MDDDLIYVPIINPATPAEAVLVDELLDARLERLGHLMSIVDVTSIDADEYYRPIEIDKLITNHVRSVDRHFDLPDHYNVFGGWPAEARSGDAVLVKGWWVRISGDPNRITEWDLSVDVLRLSAGDVVPVAPVVKQRRDRRCGGRRPRAKLTSRRR